MKSNAGKGLSAKDGARGAPYIKRRRDARAADSEELFGTEGRSSVFRGIETPYFVQDDKKTVLK
jgi:hypothetical protein